MADTQDVRPVPDPTVLTQEAVGKLEATMRVLIKTEIEHQRELFDEKLDGISNQFAARVQANQERAVGLSNQFSERLEGAVNQYNEKIDKISVQFGVLDARTAEQKSDTKAALDASLAGFTDQYNEKMATITEKLTGIANQFSERFTTYDEKISKINERFIMLDARTAEQKSDTKAALDAALAAQKEAVAAQTESSDKSINKSETATTERIKAVETLLNASTRASDDKIDDLKGRVGQIEAAKLGAAESTATTRASGTDSRAILTIAVSVILVLIALAAVLVAILKP